MDTAQAARDAHSLFRAAAATVGLFDAAAQEVGHRIRAARYEMCGARGQRPPRASRAPVAVRPAKL